MLRRMISGAVTMTKRLALLLALVGLLTACKRTVTYRVSGTAQHVQLTYTSPGTVSMSNEAATLPWERSMPMGRVANPLMVSAMTEEKGVEVTCQILVNGTVKAEARTTGGFAAPAVCQAF
jgi:hypothetical protein